MSDLARDTSDCNNRKKLKCRQYLALGLLRNTTEKILDTAQNKTK